MSFFQSLQSLPPNPDVQSLRQVFQWYDDGFLRGVDYEADPVAAWRLCAPTPPYPPFSATSVCSAPALPFCRCVFSFTTMGGCSLMVVRRQRRILSVHSWV